MKINVHSELDTVDFGFGQKQVNSGSLSRNPAMQAFVGELIEVARKEWADDVWRWFDEHRDKRILSISKWFISFTFRVKHCEVLVKVLAGPRPEGV